MSKIHHQTSLKIGMDRMGYILQIFRSYPTSSPSSGLSQRNGYIAILFKLPHPSAEYSGSENGHIREKMDCHIHWMSELRTYDLYIMVW